MNRTGRGTVSGTRAIAGDATDPAFTTRVCAGADAAYFCLNAANDVAAALITLGTQAGAAGRVWHLPVAAARTTRQIINQAYALAGRKPRILAAGRTTLHVLGLVKPAMREYLHTLYQFSERWVVDDTAFRAAFGAHATPLDEALATTIRW